MWICFRHTVFCTLRYMCFLFVFCLFVCLCGLKTVNFHEINRIVLLLKKQEMLAIVSAKSQNFFIARKNTFAGVDLWNILREKINQNNPNSFRSLNSYVYEELFSHKCFISRAARKNILSSQILVRLRKNRQNRKSLFCKHSLHFNPLSAEHIWWNLLFLDLVHQLILGRSWYGSRSS